ncbi:MAG: hypothetical protein IJU23_09845 [Proteobacteria bacterium]|nr:hypothetical protein [Pseudomonadota bacterium]
MFKRTVIFTLACCASAALMAGCGGESESTSVQCPETCPDNQICDESTGFQCVDKTTETCPESCPDNQICNESTGYKCVEKKCPDSCPDNQHCDESTDYKCVENQAVEKCPDSCPDNQHCDASTDYKCVENQAIEKCPESCPNNQHCDETTGYKCVEDTTSKCPVTCGENKHCDEEIGQCVEDGTPCSETCPEGEYCDYSKGECVKNETACAETCLEGYYCNEKTLKCEKIKECFDDTEMVCSGNILMKCTSEGTYEVVQDCAENSEICLVGQDGVSVCKESKCQPGSSRCEGSVIQVCNDYHEYVAGDDCAANADTPVCEDANNAATCVAKCELGDIKCDGMNVMECMESGEYEIKATCDGTTNTCLVDPGTNKASCVEFECTADYRKCDGDILKKCDGGWIVDDADCSKIGSVCLESGNNQASCVQQNCQNGEKKCDGYKLMECKDYAFVLLESCLDKNAFCVPDKTGAACVIPQELDDDTDTDEDGIPDYLECANDPDDKKNCEDTDNDGTPDYLDKDSDGDGIPDKIEANNGDGAYEPDDADYDDIPNYRDSDSDGNGVSDSVECCGGNTACLNAKENGLFTYCIDTDGDGILNFIDFDNDNDGATDVDEIKGMVINPPTPEAGKFSGYGCYNKKNTLGTVSSPVDCDNNAVPDYMDFDSDGDGLCDSVEGTLRTTIMVNGVKRGSYARYNSDTDGDGIPDVLEAAGVSDVSKLPAKDPKTGCYKITAPKDSDGDGIPDMLEVDSDDDGLSDYFETYCCNTANHGTNYCKNNKNWCSDSSKADSDGDGVTDLVEYGAETDPLDVKDNPQSKGNFVFVVPYKGESTPKKQSLSFATGIQTVDMYFMVDSSTTMYDEMAILQNKLPTILQEIKCKEYSTTPCEDNHDCEAYDDAICSENKRCIKNPSSGDGCLSDMQTGIGWYSSDSCFRSTVPINADVSKTTAEIANFPADEWGFYEPPFQMPLCAILGNEAYNGSISAYKGKKFCDTNLCQCQPRSTGSNCVPLHQGPNCVTGDPNRVTCVGYRKDAIKIYLQAYDEEQCCSDAPTNNSCPGVTYCKNLTTDKGATTGAIMKEYGVRWIGLYGTGNPSTGNINDMKKVSDNIGTYSGTLDINGKPFSYNTASTDFAVAVKSGIMSLVNTMPVQVTSSVEDVDLNAAKLIDHLEVNIKGGETVQNRVCATITNTLTNTATKYPGISNLLPGTVVCYDVIPVASQSIFPATTEPQVFKARVKVSGDGSVLNSGIAYFLVPPIINDGGEISN